MVLNGKEFRKILKEKGSSINACAIRLGISNAQLSRILNGKRGMGRKVEAAIIRKFTKEEVARITSFKVEIPIGNKIKKYLDEVKFSEFLRRIGMRKCDFAKLIGVSRGTLSNALHLRKGIGRKFEGGFIRAFPQERLELILV